MQILWPKAWSLCFKLNVLLFKNVVGTSSLTGLLRGLNQIMFARVLGLASALTGEAFKSSISAQSSCDSGLPAAYDHTDHTVLLETLYLCSQTFLFYLLDLSFLVYFAGPSSFPSLLNVGTLQASLSAFTTRSSHSFSWLWITIFKLITPKFTSPPEISSMKSRFIWVLPTWCLHWVD